MKASDMLQKLIISMVAHIALVASVPSNLIRYLKGLPQVEMSPLMIPHVAF